MFCGAGGGTYDRGCDGAGAILGDEHGGHSGTIRIAQNRAQVLRILDVIKCQNKRFELFAVAR